MGGALGMTAQPFTPLLLLGCTRIFTGPEGQAACEPLAAWLGGILSLVAGAGVAYLAAYLPANRAA